MSTDFEWRFGDELPEDQGRQGQHGQPRWRRWLPWLLALLLVVGGAYAWWRDRQRTLAQAEAQVEQVAQLELRALDQGDGELYLSFQDPADRSWEEAQAAYLETAGLPLPLQNVTSRITTTIDSARIVGERAEVVVIHKATLPSGEKALFRAVRFYRYTSDGRWLHTRMEPDYGGHDVIFVADDLEITVFANDPIRVDALARRLAALPYEFCSLGPCQQYSLLGLGLTSDPEEARGMAKTLGVDTTLSLSLAANLEEAAEADDAVLPASFLLGAPANAAAQAAWETSLGQFLVDQLITREIGPRPENDHGGALVEERLRAWSKAKLGVSEPISPNLDLVRYALDNEAWIPLERLWDVEPNDPRRRVAAAEIDLLLAYIEQEHGASAVAWLLHALRDAHRMEELLNDVPWPGRSSLELRFPAYVRERTATATDDVSAFASYDLLLGCLEEKQSFRAAELWGWRLGAAEPVLLSARAPDDPLFPVSWSPDGSRLLLQGESRRETPFLLLRAGSAVLQRRGIPNSAQPVSGWLGRAGWSPDGSRLAYHVPVDFHQPSGSVDVETRIVDFETDEEVTLAGRFIAWSPDGSRLLYGEPVDSNSASDTWRHQLALRDFFVAQSDGTVPRRIGGGYAAAWSAGGQWIAIVSAEGALLTYDTAAGRSTTALDRHTVGQTLGLTGTLSTFPERPFQLAWSPDGEEIALASNLVDTKGSLESRILLVRGDEHHLLHRETGTIVGLGWTPDGRSLNVWVDDGDDFWASVIRRNGNLLLRQEKALITWAADGQHAAVTRLEADPSDVQILYVESGERRRINLPGRCSPPLWNPRRSGQEPSSEP